VRVLRYLWASPATLIGVLLSLAFKRRFISHGVLVGEGAKWPRRLGWRYRAVTLGHCVLCVDAMDADLMRHELVHVAQFERWGPLMALAYPWASLRAVSGGQHPYRDNHFEVQARELSGESERPPT
jgi:hypothetical protein